MLSYIVRRILGTIPVILLISLLVFMLVQAAPGDPADLLLSDEATAADIEDARKRWGLDQPIHVQYGKFLVAALQGDLSTSFRYTDPVVTMILDRLPDLSVRMRFSNKIASQFKFREVYVVQERDGMKLAGIN